MEIPAQMQAVFIQDGHCVLRECAAPAPKQGEVLIKIAYAGLNRADLFQKEGTYPPPQGAPNIPGLEVSGHIVALGDGVSDWAVGDCVCALLAGGGYAEYVAVPAAHCLPIPQFSPSPQPSPRGEGDLLLAAALPECVTTIWMALFEDARIKPSERVLIHGGASGIGTTGIQMMRAHGCEVWTTVGSPEKADLCASLGATPILYKELDFAEIIREAGSVDVVLDMVGGEYIERSLKCLRTGGRLVSLAFLQGNKVELSAGRLLLKRLHWMGATLRARSDEEKAQYLCAIRQTVWPWIAQDHLKPVIDSVFPLEEVEKAQDRMEKYLHCGKILLQIGH